MPRNTRRAEGNDAFFVFERDVYRHGGLDAKNVDRDFPPFEINDEVVLLLERGQNGWYWPLNGPDGAFKLTKEGRAHAYGKVGEVSQADSEVGRPLALARLYGF